MNIESYETLDINIEKVGPQGYSAYEVYLNNGGTLSMTEWLDSLKGEKGDTGLRGPEGYTPIKGVDYVDGKDGKNATVNGLSTTNIIGGNNISVRQVGNDLYLDFSGETTRIVKVDALPEIGQYGVIYLVQRMGRATQDIYDEYIWDDPNFEFIGTTTIDLSDYYSKEEVNSLLNNKATKEELETLENTMNSLIGPINIQLASIVGEVE